jgi:hypothetical protein
MKEKAEKIAESLRLRHGNCSGKSKTPKERMHKFRSTEKGRESLKKDRNRIRGTAQKRAYYQIEWLVRTGKIPRARDMTCSDCGEPAQVYDHRDYSMPKDVTPVCRKCNASRGTAKNP